MAQTFSTHAKRGFELLNGSPFLTELDPIAAIKGSRDPLGFQAIWTRLGREVVGNLTTVTTSVRGFTTLLLGYDLARRAIEERGLLEEDFIGLVLKLEQVVAYSRFAYHEQTHDTPGDIRGIQRVKARLHDYGAKVPIGTQRDRQILSNQKTYGLWGLFYYDSRQLQAESGGALERPPSVCNDVLLRASCQAVLGGLMRATRRGD